MYGVGKEYRSVNNGQGDETKKNDGRRRRPRLDGPKKMRITNPGQVGLVFQSVHIVCENACMCVCACMTLIHQHTTACAHACNIASVQIDGLLATAGNHSNTSSDA